MAESKDIMTARKEIYLSFKFCNFCTRKIGLSFIDDAPNGFIAKLATYLLFFIAFSSLLALVAAEFTYVISLLISSTSVAEFVASLHIVGYGTLSVGKLLTIWLKKNEFRQLICELADIWPVFCDDCTESTIKKRSLKNLRIGQFGYAFFNLLGVLFYNLTPIVVFLYRMKVGANGDLGFVWHATYPFDKTKPVYHELVYVFEAYAGASSVWCMLGSDLLFTCMASHISMLLRILQVRIRRLGQTESGKTLTSTGSKCDEHYEDIVSVIKIHQRLIEYHKDLENAFSAVNLINVILSSIDICVVVFNIALLESWMELSNKFFLGAALTQVGILCWYADDIYRASSGIAEAVYDSGWYMSSKRCQRALLFLAQRSQKPLYFTALKFRPITLLTYNSILTTAYSYFALLYTIYRSD